MYTITEDCRVHLWIVYVWDATINVSTSENRYEFIADVIFVTCVIQMILSSCVLHLLLSTLPRNRIQCCQRCDSFWVMSIGCNVNENSSKIFNLPWWVQHSYQLGTNLVCDIPRNLKKNAMKNNWDLKYLFDKFKRKKMKTIFLLYKSLQPSTGLCLKFICVCNFNQINAINCTIKFDLLVTQYKIITNFFSPPNDIPT